MITASPSVIVVCWHLRPLNARYVGVLRVQVKHGKHNDKNTAHPFVIPKLYKPPATRVASML
jgi:hypothetical protein